MKFPEEIAIRPGMLDRREQEKAIVRRRQSL